MILSQFNFLTPAELIILEEHLKLGMPHLKQQLTKSEVERLLGALSLSQMQIAKIGKSNTEISGNLSLVLNTIFTATFGAWIGYSAFWGLSLASFWIFSMIIAIAASVGVFIGYQSIRATKQQSLEATNKQRINLLQIEILKKLEIKALVIIGGDDSNTNACVLAEYYKEINAGVQVIGCPKTIDGDLKNEMIETSFGFDTACKVYAEVIGNIQRDCNSARKYWHFIKLMGRSASHIALECALQVQPNVCIISEEVEAQKLSLDDIVTDIANVVAKRAEDGNNFGTVLIPEGLIEFIPSIGKLIEEELHRQERSVTWFANKLYCDRTNTYKIFKRQSIDTELLLRISQVLHVNFFEYYSRECQNREKQSTLM